MTVAELIRQLEYFEPDHQVVVQDAWSYAPVYDVDLARGRIDQVELHY